ncbi:PfkB family carbohydrate kinase [Arenicellales bacterium nBUS_45]
MRKKTCFISGKFNVLHPGHLRLFRHAKEISDFLIVGVYCDNFSDARGIIVGEADRLEGVKANKWVDQVVLIKELGKTLLEIKPDIVLKGKEHEGVKNVELGVVQGYGGQLKFAGGDSRLSSMSLIKSETHSDEITFQKGQDFFNRHEFSRSQLIETVESMATINTLVIGDLIVDRYVDCQPIGLSAEDPTVVVAPLEEETYIGGAGIVASHSAMLGGTTYFLSVCGDDEIGHWANRRLGEAEVVTDVFFDADRPTTRKTRYRAQNKTLLRLNEFRDHQIDNLIVEKLLRCVLDRLPKVDLIIFSDFSYGLFSDQMIRKIIQAGAQEGVFMAADSQSSSQIGDIGRFPGVDLLTPTEREARLAVRDNISGLVGVSEKLRAVTNAKFLPITLGSEGVFLHRPDAVANDWTDDQVPALNRNPVDVSGAGDAFLVSTAMCLAAGEDIWAAIYVGSVASACQVSRVGNTPLTRKELMEKMDL